MRADSFTTLEKIDSQRHSGGNVLNIHEKLGGGFKHFLFSPRKMGK